MLVQGLTYRVKLNVDAGSIPAVIKLKQYEDNVTLVFELFSEKGQLDLYDQTMAGLVTGKIRGTKPDGNGISYNIIFSSDGKACAVGVTKQMTAVEGRSFYELVLTVVDDEDSTIIRELITASFVIVVDEAALDMGTIISESVIEEIRNKADGAYIENNYLYLTSNGIVISDPIGPIGGSGSVELEKVTFTGTTSSLVSDHTSSQIKNAVENGLLVYGLYGNELYSLNFSTSSSAEFIKLSYSTNGLIDIKKINVLNDSCVYTSKAFSEGYQKPPAGIPASDLTSTVQTSLEKANDAVRESTQIVKTTAMTQPVGYDSVTGKFYTAPGGSGGVTKYTVTISGSGPQYIASMSSSEIYTAVQGGNIVEAVVDGETLTLSKSTTSAAVFVGHALTESEFIGLALAISGNYAMTTPIPIQTKGIADAAGYFTNDTVEGALAEIGAQLNGLASALDDINDILEGAL